jgi:predicted TIM-barrel fold metal-dependent hydrolase
VTAVNERVIDADGHVLEPLSAWASAPAAFRPRIERDATGYEHVIVGDNEVVAVSLGLLATPGSKMSDTGAMRTLEEALPGGYDPVRRLADMDLEGIDAAVLYPSVGLNFWAIEDPRAAVALARAYNDWLASYCEADPGRLFGAAMVPLQDPSAAAAELRRSREELGFPAAFVRPNPCVGRAIAHPAHEVVWATAEELGVAIGIHEGSSVTIPTLGADRPFNPFILHAVSHAFEQMLACASLIAFGVLERHPGLRVVFLESGGGWGPFWLQRLDEQVHGFGDFCPEMRLRPSEYFARQCWISFEVDEATLSPLAPLIGEDRIVWGSDYPHHDATFPGAVKELRAAIAPLSAEAQAKVLGGNARALYQLP